jgi:hypothetical protein
MAEKVKLSKDGSSIDFVQSDSIPTSVKKFRQSPEIEGFYRFIFENDLQKEAYEILEVIIAQRKAKKAAEKKEAKAEAKALAAVVTPEKKSKVETPVAKAPVKSSGKAPVAAVAAKPVLGKKAGGKETPAAKPSHGHKHDQHKKGSKK